MRQSSNDQEITGSQKWLAGEGGDLNSGTSRAAVGIVVKEAGCRVVDQVVVCICRSCHTSTRPEARSIQCSRCCQCREDTVFKLNRIVRETEIGDGV